MSLHKGCGSGLGGSSSDPALLFCWNTQRDFRGQLCFVGCAESLSPSCFPELLLTNYLRSGCDSRAEVFALNIFQPGCWGSAISPSYSSVTFSVNLTGNTSLLGSASETWGWNPPLVSVCAHHPHRCFHTALSLLRGLGSRARPPSPQPTIPVKHRHSDLCLSALRVSVGGVSSAFPPSLTRWLWARTSWKEEPGPSGCAVGFGAHRCHLSQLRQCKFSPSSASWSLFSAPEMSWNKTLPDCSTT